MKRSENRPTIINLYNDFIQLLGPDYFDEADNETNDNEQPNTTDMPDLESEKSAKQIGQRLKMSTPNQTLSRLPVSLAQLEAENNSEKLKNEIRQLLYSLYRSKKLSKTIYKHLMNTI